MKPQSRRIIVNAPRRTHPHRHDADIERLWRTLRRLINERARDWMSDDATERMYSPETRARMSAAQSRLWEQAGPEARAARGALMTAARRKQAAKAREERDAAIA